MLAATVRPLLPMSYETTLTPGPGIDLDCPRNTRYLGYREVQHRTERGIVELSAPCRKAEETGCTGCTLGGARLFSPLPSLEPTVECRFA